MNSLSRTLLVLTGADRFREGTGFEDQPAFRRSVDRFRRQLQARTMAPISAANTLDLFNDGSHAVAMVQRLESWLDSQDQKSWDALVFYYVGHGMFHPPANDFFMAIRDTTPRYLYQSSLQMSCLAVALETWARTKLVIMILDCCYAGAAKVGLMSGDQASHISRKFAAVNGAEPRGLAQLCAAGKDYAAYVLDGAEYTLFTDALIYVLDHGIEEAGRFLSVNDLAEGIRDRIRKVHPQEAVDPVVNLSHAQGEWHSSFLTFPNAAYIPRPPESAIAPTIAAVQAGELGRDWIEEEEIAVSVVLSDSFNERLEQGQTLGLKTIYQNLSERHWLVCSHARVYHIVDNLSKQLPEIDWSADLEVSAKCKPKISVKLLLIKKRLQKISLGGHTVSISPNLFGGPEVVTFLKRWMKTRVRAEKESEEIASNDRAILLRLQRYLASGSDTMPEALGSALSSEASSWAACAAMLLIRRQRVLHRSPLKRVRLRLPLDALCARPAEPNTHRYWSQLSYLYGESGLNNSEESIRLLTNAINLRDKSGSSKYRRYELSRALYRIASDLAFQQGRPSDVALIPIVLADLHAAQHLLDNRERPRDKQIRQSWQALNRIHDEDIATFPTPRTDLRASRAAIAQV